MNFDYARSAIDSILNFVRFFPLFRCVTVCYVNLFLMVCYAIFIDIRCTKGFRKISASFISSWQWSMSYRKMERTWKFVGGTTWYTSSIDTITELRPQINNIMLLISVVHTVSLIFSLYCRLFEHDFNSQTHSKKKRCQHI